MHRQANKYRSERSFQVGDQVYLKLQPYVQASVARLANHKLYFKFLGPYKILEKIGGAAYKLDLPPSAATFHVSQLKSSMGNNQVTSVPPSDLVMF